jgi:hypothetical protein
MTLEVLNKKFYENGIQEYENEEINEKKHLKSINIDTNGFLNVKYDTGFFYILSIIPVIIITYMQLAYNLFIGKNLQFINAL